jgi:hypothetical protein
LQRCGLCDCWCTDAEGDEREEENGVVKKIIKKILKNNIQIK